MIYSPKLTSAPTQFGNTAIVDIQGLVYHWWFWLFQCRISY